MCLWSLNPKLKSFVSQPQVRATFSELQSQESNVEVSKNWRPFFGSPYDINHSMLGSFVPEIPITAVLKDSTQDTVYCQYTDPALKATLEALKLCQGASLLAKPNSRNVQKSKAPSVNPVFRTLLLGSKTPDMEYRRLLHLESWFWFGMMFQNLALGSLRLSTSTCTIWSLIPLTGS